MMTLEGTPPKDGKMSQFYLHAYCPKGAYDDLEDVVFCREATSWEVTKSGGHIIIKNGPDPKDSVMLRLAKGCRFYILLNDPTRVQRPNGSIIWRWEG